MAGVNKSNLIDRILLDVCLDDRIDDGIFKLEENIHIDVLREYLIRHGTSGNDAKEFCNRVVEGRFPERQAYNSDGILVTFPTPKHKHNAIARGTHFEENPAPQVGSATRPSSKEPQERMKDAGIKRGLPKSSIPNADSAATNQLPEPGLEPKKEVNIFQRNGGLNVEPIGGDQPSDDVPPATPAAPLSPPKTPQIKAAEKEIVRQIMATDDTAVTNVANVLNITEALEKQLTELYKHADKMGVTTVD